MIESKRLMLQVSALAAIAVVGLGSPISVLAAPAKVAVSNPNLTPEQLSAQRLLLRYTQLWNMYRFRNDVTMKPEQAAKVDQLIANVQPPLLHADLPFADIRAAILANAKELTTLLQAETKNGGAPQAAKANLDYLKGTLLAGLKNPKQYAMSDEAFRKEFQPTLENSSSLPPYMTARGADVGVKPPATAASGTSQ